MASAAAWIGTVLLVVVCTIGVAANGLLVYFGWKEKLYKKTYNLYIMNLAIADMILSASFIIFPLPVTPFESWPLGLPGCFFGEFMKYISTSVSVNTLLAMSIDRYRAISSLTQARCRNKGRKTYCGLSAAKMTILLIWLFAAPIPILHFAKDFSQIKHPPKGDPNLIVKSIGCKLDSSEFTQPRLLSIIMLEICFGPQKLGITICYIAIAMKMCMMGRRLRRESTHRQKQGQSESIALESSRRKAVAVSRIILFLIIVHLICTMPIHIQYWLTYAYPQLFWENPEAFRIYRAVSWYLTYCYPVLNIFSLVMTSSEYRYHFDNYLSPLKPDLCTGWSISVTRTPKPKSDRQHQDRERSEIQLSSAVDSNSDAQTFSGFSQSTGLTGRTSQYALSIRSGISRKSNVSRSDAACAVETLLQFFQQNQNAATNLRDRTAESLLQSIRSPIPIDTERSGSRSPRQSVLEEEWHTAIG